ncbi:MAG: hypothetical protein A2268_09565 [Candidatus Raymondbacteria bacterium RifOxyA12_full_50_37]|uniref:GTPase Obg n=1 Tax=Candidatus Raymondbacteria bacterium RIFOXYD12_FULL_49_13 TaxID=1817890 RepID=A0A1F7F1J6_UNCRA|nr:MAG: hypothetical protein A2268_09565 [Candidatus Raymondbacteria bacterium RifOxyA12_full_50_37]OGJ93912.1 MAG: hypothetical protein A2248_06730 [Candidatus Raymondbacteria bacterium RIFOXYA2_FULL_49_16]OGJ98219.1 MAG: hypothetical protein A2453_00435 [Candidatus Raymondbacteria bacterium RIFOXYC2_FULL_50_21]OGK00452.1 MAG: hypothetical protein A2519_10610 [Candidatus Raymondbacteria bacterium RIFOXYD12_FULL_49_13]OGK05173.1 MAG: hypothetical protein A2487_08230 [Candidatus Raymondbacteria 
MIDRATITVTAGNGGNGCVAFRREKYIPKGGPSGGDGGDGGNVFAVGHKDVNTLINFRYNQLFEAGKGEHGKGSNMYGKDGQDVFIPLPLGTVIMDQERRIICDMQNHGQTLLLAEGGKGGKGNTHFKSSIRQAPRFATPGKPGIERKIILELKLIADVGLVGEPNAGKSTLLSKISNAHPKIADYPFTTLEPHLGIVKAGDDFSFVVADIPGLIEGAHDGKGLGHEFLRHIERTKVLVYLLDLGAAQPPSVVLRKLRNELKLYNPALLSKPSLIVLNKTDIKKGAGGIRASKKRPVLAISALKGIGLQKLIFAIKDTLNVSA